MSELFHIFHIANIVESNNSSFCVKVFYEMYEIIFYKIIPTDDHEILMYISMVEDELDITDRSQTVFIGHSSIIDDVYVLIIRFFEPCVENV